MPLLPLDQISIRPDRIRKEFDGPRLHELANDILKNGLLHPPVVDGEGYILVGERRLRAVRMLAAQGLSFRHNGDAVPAGSIPITRFHSLEEVDRLEAELSENVIRADISWQEKAAATAKLFNLRQMQRQMRGEEEVSRPQAIKELGEEVAKKRGLSTERPLNPGGGNESATTKDVRQDLLLAAWGHDEEVIKAPSAKEALKIITTKLEAEHRLALSREYKKKAPTTSHNLIHGSCIDELPKIPSGTFHCVITDPPYGVNIDKYADLQGGVDHHYDDSPDVLFDILDCFEVELFRVTKEKAHLYLFCDFSFFEEIKLRFDKAGWDVWPRPLIWHRSDSTGMLPRAEHGPRRNYECILYAIKGAKRVNFVANDVIPIPSERGGRTAARKPVKLFEELLRRSCLPGDLVLDPCAGSGPVFDAAQNLECFATGIELNEELVGVCTKRLTLMAMSPEDRVKDLLDAPTQGE